MRDWIPVKERLPKELGRHLVFVGGHIGVSLAHFCYEDRWVCIEADASYSSEEVTHWRPLPNKPEPQK